MDTESVQVYDHGHSNTVHSPVYWVGVNIHGVGVKVDIKHLQFDKSEIQGVPFLDES
jgi:hypothetical protein